MKSRHLLAAFGLALGAASLTGIATGSADASQAFTCTDRSGGVNGAPGQITAVRAAHHDGYDRIVFEFAPTAAGAIPAYRLTQQASSHFIKDPSGLPVTLEGSAGIRAVFQNTDIAAGAPSDLKPELPIILESAKLGDFERVSSYGIGLSHLACFKVQELGQTRLVIDVVAPSTPSAAQASTPAASVASSAVAQTSQSPAPQALASTGHAAQLAVAMPAEPAGHSIVPLLALAAIAAGALLLLGGRLATRP